MKIDHALAYMISIVEWGRPYLKRSCTTTAHFDILGEWELPCADFDYFVSRGVFECLSDIHYQTLVEISGEPIDADRLKRYAADRWKPVKRRRELLSICRILEAECKELETSLSSPLNGWYLGNVPEHRT